jgi:hypothetical protein
MSANTNDQNSIEDSVRPIFQTIIYVKASLEQSLKDNEPPHHGRKL